MNTKSQLVQLRTIFIVIASGLLLFFVGAWFLGHTKGAFFNVDAQQLQYLKTLVILLAFAGIPASHYFHKKKTSHINANYSNREKLIRYRTSYFVKMATFEGLGLISLLSYLISNDKTFLLIFALFMVVLFINFPTKTKIAEELQTTPEALFESE